MPEDRKVFDIAKPVATPATRPVISSGPPAPDPMVKPPTKVSVNVLDEPAIAPAGPVTSIPILTTPAEPAPSVAVPAQPVAAPVQPASNDAPVDIEPEIESVAVNAPPSIATDSAVPLEASGSSIITPALPGAPVSDFSNVPKFGELQPKVDAHPLFSGSKEHRVKVRRMPRFVKPTAVLLVLLIVAYLAIDAGVVRGSSHLPFHIFKQKTIASNLPTINQPATTDAQAAQTESAAPPQSTQQSGTTSTTTQPYETMINKFILAMRNKDKATADSLESAALQASTKKETKTTSFYDACQTAGVYCTGLFTASFIDAAEKATKDYKTQAGVAGKEITYTVKVAGSGTATSTNVLTIAAVPSGSSWLVDFVDASGGTNFVSNQ